MDWDELVAAERERQDIEWGEQNHLPGDWLAILVEEVGEVGSAIIAMSWKPEKQRTKNLETELTHVAAVAKAMWECGKRNNWF